MTKTSPAPGASAIGQSIPRAETRRLLAGRGLYVADINRPRQLHAVFLRSPVAHGRIVRLETGAAAALDGVYRVLTWQDLSRVCKPMVTRAALAPDHRPPAQFPLADGHVHYQGEPVALVLATNLDAARDAAEMIDLEIDAGAVAALPAQGEPGTPAHADAPVPMMHKVFGETAPAVSTDDRTFMFERQTGVPMEPRGVLADYDSADRALTVWQSGQVPHQTQDVLADLLEIPGHKVQVICPDVGGAFGIKLHAYADEVAVAAASRLTGRPVKWISDRLESFLSDVHAREFMINASASFDDTGAIDTFDASVRMGAGAYSIYPRASIGDAGLTSTMIGAAYAARASRIETTVLAQNKALTGAYRGVGQPVAMAVTEILIDDAAHAAGVDPLEYRRRHYPPDGDRFVSAGGISADALSLHGCLDRLETFMDYAGVRKAQQAARDAGRIEGIGLATLVELTAPGAGLYGAQEIDVTAEDTAIVSLLPGGVARVQVGCTDQGQGTLTGVAQIVADRLGMAAADVEVTAGDSAGPVGGGASASRGLSIGGGAAFKAATAVADQITGIAGALLQVAPDALTLSGGHVVDRDGNPRMSIADVATIGHYRQHLVPDNVVTTLSATRSYVPRSSPYFAANGIQACHLSIDPDTGEITLLNHWVVEDCGPVINPALVDGQIYGGVVQGLGAALMERCVYDEDGNLLTGSLMDYALPRADQIPPIHIAHVETPQPGTDLGIKGAGEAGTIGAIAAVWTAVNDALRPLGVQATVQPFTSERMRRLICE